MAAPAAHSNAAPDFNYLAVPTVTINGGGGFDLATVNGTEGPDTFTSAAAALCARRRRDDELVRRSSGSISTCSAVTTTPH